MSRKNSNFTRFWQKNISTQSVSVKTVYSRPWLSAGIVAAAMLLSHPVLAERSEIPRFEVHAKCLKRLELLGGGPSNLDTCLAYEQIAYDDLVRGWPHYDPAILKVCISRSRTIGLQFYTVLKMCIDSETMASRRLSGWRTFTY